MKEHVVLCTLVLVLLTGGMVQADVFQSGGAALIASQNGDGGWNWPYQKNPTAVTNAPNILAPTAMGLIAASQQSTDPNSYKAALLKAGSYLLRKRPFQITPEDGYLAVALDKVFATKAYTDYVKTNFYTPLANGKFNVLGDGTLLVNTTQYITLVCDVRDKQGLANLAAVDIGMGLYAAGLVGVDTAAWVTGTKGKLNQLKGGQLFDVFGLAAGVLGLASVGATFDPTSGDYADANGLADLAATLATYQLKTGGFTWDAYMMKEGANNEDVQVTAVAVLALSNFSTEIYGANIAKAATYLKGVQLPSGGWENYVGAGQNNEVAGEALWALGVSVPVAAK